MFYGMILDVYFNTLIFDNELNIYYLLIITKINKKNSSI